MCYLAQYLADITTLRCVVSCAGRPMKVTAGLCTPFLHFARDHHLCTPFIQLVRDHHSNRKLSNLRIFKVATWHYRCRYNLKNNCIWDNLQCCLLVPRSPSKHVMLTFDLQSRKVLFIEIVFWHVLFWNVLCMIDSAIFLLTKLFRVHRLSRIWWCSEAKIYCRPRLTARGH